MNIADLTEEAILNRKALECADHEGRMDELVRYRIEYGFECGCPEGIIYIRPELRDELQALLEDV